MNGTEPQISVPTAPTFSLEGKRALVTGASSGIGFAAASALAAAGAHVLMVARNEKKLAAHCHALSQLYDRVEYLALDITNIDATRSEVSTRGPFDILVNSAGIARHSASLETTVQDLDDVMEVNVKSAYFLTQCVAQGLIEAQQKGSLINISSQMGHTGGLDRAVYCASKHAVEGMTKALAMEWGASGIRVNTICPTFIRTPLVEETLRNPERRKWIETKIKLGRIGEVEDIMGAVVFLASDASSLITGTALMVDGGWTTG